VVGGGGGGGGEEEEEYATTATQARVMFNERSFLLFPFLSLVSLLLSLSLSLSFLFVPSRTSARVCEAV